MPEPKPIKTAHHHWWPQCVSGRWRNEEGKIHQLFCDGKVVPHSNTNSFGGIKNGHTIKLADKPTPWDHSFEDIFGTADGAFPALLAALEALPATRVENPNGFMDRFLKQEMSDAQVAILMECMLSLIVRGPRFRNSIRLLVQTIQARAGAEPPKVDELLINMNLRHALNLFKSNLGTRGKFLILKSPQQEFIFGDGFFHNFTSCSSAPHNPRVLVPLLPGLCVFYTKPSRYFTEPRVATMELTPDEADVVNNTVMTYSQNYIFYRSQQPALSADFEAGRFLEYQYNIHPGLEQLEAAFTQHHF